MNHFDDIIGANQTGADDIGTEIIREINGCTNLICLSNYYSNEEYISHTNNASHLCLNIFHFNVRSLHKKKIKKIDSLSSLFKCFNTPPSYQKNG